MLEFYPGVSRCQIHFLENQSLIFLRKTRVPLLGIFLAYKINIYTNLCTISKINNEICIRLDEFNTIVAIALLHIGGII